MVRRGDGGIGSFGASSPFFVDVDRIPIENRPFAFGAEATRRRKRDAEAETDLGLKGTFVFDRAGRALEQED